MVNNPSWDLLRPKLWKSSGMGINEILQIDFGTSVDGIDVVKWGTHLGLIEYDNETGKFFPWINQSHLVKDFVWEPFPKGVGTVADFVRYRSKLAAWREVAKNISHQRAQAILHRFPLEKEFSSLGALRLGALQHYLTCEKCRKTGLAKIRKTELTHKKAILVWAQSASYLPEEKPRNLIQIYAAEHVVSCQSRSCMPLLAYWNNWRNNLLNAEFNLFPILIETFLRERWELEELLSLHRQRVKQLLGQHKSAQEIATQVEGLQGIIQTLSKIPRRDLLSEATGGKLHWDDPGMDDFEKGWEPFTKGTRVEIRKHNGRWVKGTVVEGFLDNERAIVVKCDKKQHRRMGNYKGYGLTLMVLHNSRRGILSNIRKIN